MKNLKEFERKASRLTLYEKRILYYRLVMLLITARLRFYCDTAVRWPNVLLAGYVVALLGLLMGDGLWDRIIYGGLAAALWVEACVSIRVISGWLCGAKRVQNRDK